MRLPLFVFQERQFERPQERHEERFFMPSIRVRQPNSGATRNEDKPDPCEVKRNKGT